MTHLFRFLLPIIVAYILMAPYLGVIEGKIFPPISNISINLLNQHTPNRLNMGGLAILERSCLQTDMHFVYTYANTSTVVPWEYMLGPRAQVVGDVYWGPWTLNMREVMLQTGDLKVTMLYRCHPFYETAVSFDVGEIIAEM